MFEIKRPNHIYDSCSSINNLPCIVKVNLLVKQALSFARSCWSQLAQSLVRGQLSPCRVRFDAEDRRSVLSVGLLY
jgi:hypothetical protein